ncbi:PulJ/GspJ family protein [Crateriforma spongiae]|uniref:PulJ/GspJ family protein n=1 Tax=Crateriforma spongiae TaxID=2724528 RepID=UPI001445F153|nr:type II secretion system protein [Crateriforma spongiae]
MINTSIDPIGQRVNGGCVQRRPYPNPFTGFSLIEVLVSLSLASMLGTIAVGLLLRCQHLSDGTTNQLDQIQTFSRLADTFRDDVHTALSADTKTNASVTLRYAGDSVIQYQWDQASRRIVRSIRRSDQVVASEFYVLSSKAHVKFEQASSPDIVRLNLDTAGRSERSTNSVVCQAVVHRWPEVSK